MKKVFCLAIVLMLISMPLALATFVDSRENDDLTDVEIIDVEYRDDDDDIVTPFTTPRPTDSVADATPGVTPDATPEVTPDTTPDTTPEVTPDATPEVTPDVTPEVTPDATPEVTKELIEIVPVNPEDDPPAPPVVEIVNPPEEIEKLIEEMTPIYELTVIYVYSDGTPAAETIRETLEAGQPVDTPIPYISGYTSSGGYHGTMPARNLQVTVIYYPIGTDEETISISDYETPLGLGASMMNVGVCVE